MSATDFATALETLSKKVQKLEQVTTGTAMATGGAPGDGDSEFDSITVDGVILDRTPPDAPTGLLITTGTFYDSIFADVEWTEAVAGRKAISYTVQLDRQTAADPEAWELEKWEYTIGTSFRFENLRPNTTYRARVHANNSLGIGGAWTEYTTFTTDQDATIPAAPTSVQVARGASSVLVTWTEVDDADVRFGNGTYEIEIATDLAFTSNVRAMRSSATVVSFGGIDFGANWYARVRAIDASGNIGPWNTTPSTVYAGAISEDMIVGNFSAAKINYGTMSGDRIQANTLDVNAITTSTLSSGVITLSSSGAIKIGTATATGGSGIYMSAAGIVAFQSGVEKFRLSSTGVATFKGNIDGATMTASSAVFGGATMDSQGIRISVASFNSYNAPESLRFVNGSQVQARLWTYSHLLYIETPSSSSGAIYMRAGDIRLESYNGGTTFFNAAAGGCTAHTGLTVQGALDHYGNLYVQSGCSMYGGQEFFGNMTNWGQTTFRAKIWGPSIGSSTAGGNTIQRYGVSGSGNELYYNTSTGRLKAEITPESELQLEYLEKLLRTELPSWDALKEIEEEDIPMLMGTDGKFQPQRNAQRKKKIVKVDPERRPENRGTAHNRVGPIIEEMSEVFPEAVIFADPDTPIGVDETLIMNTLWFGFKKLTADLKAAKAIDNNWPLAASKGNK